MSGNKRFEGIEIIRNPNLPIEIINEETNEIEVFHMVQNGNTLHVSDDLYKSCQEIFD